MTDDLLDEAEALPLAAVIALGVLAAVLLVAAVLAQVAAARIRRELRVAESQLVDPRTGLLPRSALRIRLGAEIAWAITSSTPIAVAVLRVRGPRFRQAAAVLRHAMREEESAFLLGNQHVAVELWGTTAESVDFATERIGLELARAGHPVVDAGVACALRDGADVETLVAAARHDMRPVDELSSGRGGAGGFEAALRMLSAFAAFGLLALVTWRLLPAAIEPVLGGGDAARTGEQLAYALVAVLGLPLGAALLHATCWNVIGGFAPRSRPLGRVDLWTIGALTVAVAAPLVWGVFAPLQPASMLDAFGAGLSVALLLLLVLLHGRQFIHLHWTVLGALAATGVAVAWCGVEVGSWPLVAHAGQLLFAASAGALLARCLRRPGWFVVALLAAAALDAWNWLDEGALDRAVRELLGDDLAADLLPHLLLAGPSIAGQALFVVPVLSLAVVSTILAWTHDWRYDMRLVTGVVLAAWWGTMLGAELADERFPLLPAIVLVVLVVVCARGIMLRARSAAWRWFAETPQ